MILHNKSCIINLEVSVGLPGKKKKKKKEEEEKPSVFSGNIPKKIVIQLHSSKVYKKQFTFSKFNIR